MRAILTALLCLLPGGLAAQSWEAGSFDNGAWFEATTFAPGFELSVHCGNRSPGGDPLPQTDEPYLTGVYEVFVTVNHPGVTPPGPGAAGSVRTDLVVVAGPNGYLLPGAWFDELNATGWVHPLGMGDPLIAALLGADRVALQEGSRLVAELPTAGLREGLTATLAYCHARLAALGHPVPAAAGSLVAALPAPSAPPQQPSSGGVAPDLLAAVERHLTAGCSGPATKLDGWLSAGDLDRDGVLDPVLHWDAVQCQSSLPRPFCGASQCAVDLFLSRKIRAGDRPDTILSPRVSLIPAADGVDLLVSVRLGPCTDMGLAPNCQMRWTWNGQEVVPLR